MTEPNGMTSADLAMAEHMFGGGWHDPSDEFAEDEQMFEGNVVLVDSRSLTDTSRTVVQKIRDELDAEVVVLPDPHTPKKRIKRSKAIVSDVGLKDIGDSIEPDSTVSVIVGSYYKAESRDSILAGIPDDCTARVFHDSGFQKGDLDELAEFFGVRHSQKPSFDNAMESLGLDDEALGKSGYGIDFKNGRMGVWTIENGEETLSYPLALSSIKGVDERSSQRVVKQAAIRIAEREREMDLLGKLIEDRVVLEAITEQDAKLPGPRHVRRSEPIAFTDIRKPDIVLSDLGLSGDMPLPDSPAARNAFYQLIVGGSQSYEYPTIDQYQAVGWVDTKSNGLAWVNSDSAFVADESWSMASVSDIRGYAPLSEQAGEDVNIKQPPMSDYSDMIERLSSFFDSLNHSGRVSIGTYIAAQGSALSGATPVALFSYHGPTSAGKSSAMAWANLTSSTQHKDTFMSIESTKNAMKSAMEVGTGLPVFIDDFRVTEDAEKAEAMTSAIGTAIRVAYGSTGAGRKRMKGTQNGVKSDKSNGGVNLHPLIGLTSEDPLATYTYISASDLTRLFEVPFNEKPATDSGVAMSNAHESGAFTSLGSLIVNKTFGDIGKMLDYDTSKRATVSMVHKMQDERMATYRRSMEEAPHQEIRSENMLAFLRFGAQQVIDALFMDRTVQDKAREMFEVAERELWIPQVDKIVAQVRSGELTLGASVIDSMLAMEGQSIRILREDEPVENKKSHPSVRPDGDLTVVARVFTKRSANSQRFLAVNTVRLAHSRALGNLSSATISRNLMTIKGADKTNVRIEPTSSPSKCVIIPIENTGIPADSVLFKKFDDDDTDVDSDPDF